MKYYSYREGCEYSLPVSGGETLRDCIENTEKYLSGWDDSPYVIYKGKKLVHKSSSSMKPIPEPPKSYGAYRREMINWLDEEVDAILGVAGEYYSEEPVVVYSQLSDLLKNLKV